MEELNKLYEIGEIKLNEIIKSALYDYDCNIFKKIDFDDNSIFKEPLLFSHFSTNNRILSVEQILFNYYNKKPIDSYFISNRGGLIFVPNFGVLSVNKMNQTKFRVKYVDDNFNIYNKLNLVEYELIKPIYLNLDDFKIEITSFCNPYTEKHFLNINYSIVHNKTLINNYKKELEKAFYLLKSLSINDYILFCNSVKRIVIFEDDSTRNFATKENHGTIYISVSDDSNFLYFLEEVVHQASHVIFNTITFDISKFFKIDPNIKCKVYLHKNDNRTLNGYFHGLYTTNKIVETFLKLLQLDLSEFSQLEIHEIKGRLSINKLRVFTALNKDDTKAIFTDMGTKIYQYLDESLKKQIIQNIDLFDFDLSNQFLVFDFKLFLEKNPLSIRS